MDKSERKQIDRLIQEIARGNQNALVLLYEKVGGRMLSVAKGVTGNIQLAEDAVQESLIKIVRYAESFKKTDNGYGWIMTVVRNESLTIIKKYRPNDANIDEFFNLTETKYDHSYMQTHTELKLAMEKLSPPDRKLIWMRYVLDMTVRDIAKELGIPKSTVAYKLKQAEELLKKQLE